MSNKIFKTAAGSILYEDGTIVGSRTDVENALKHDMQSSNFEDIINASFVYMNYFPKD